MSELIITSCLKRLTARALAGGGFAARDGSGYRADATAWSIIALAAAGQAPELVKVSRARLVRDQLPDGRVPVSPDHPEALWATPLAILAWNQSAPQQEAQARAVRFLLGTSGTHWQRRPADFMGNDPAIQGWPWIAGTHSWVASTALAIMALKTAGYGGEARVGEGVRLLLDRQLVTGGWNYGNTTVFGTELRPMPETTGIALNALQDRTTRAKVQGSLKYLSSTLPSLRTPYSLAWSLLGLGAWQERPGDPEPLLLACWQRQEQYGAYDTTSLALLLLARLSPAGLESLFAGEPGAPGFEPAV
jgi:hypothetical protein